MASESIETKKDAALINFPKIEKICEDREWTIYEMCRRANINHTIYYNMRNGKHSPRLGTLRKFAQTLDLNVSDLFVEGNQLRLWNDSCGDRITFSRN